MTEHSIRILCFGVMYAAPRSCRSESRNRVTFEDHTIRISRGVIRLDLIRPRDLPIHRLRLYIPEGSVPRHTTTWVSAFASSSTCPRERKCLGRENHSYDFNDFAFLNISNQKHRSIFLAARLTDPFFGCLHAHYLCLKCRIAYISDSSKMTPCVGHNSGECMNTTMNFIVAS